MAFFRPAPEFLPSPRNLILEPPLQCGVHATPQLTSPYCLRSPLLGTGHQFLMVTHSGTSWDICSSVSIQPKQPVAMGPISGACWFVLFPKLEGQLGRWEPVSYCNLSGYDGLGELLADYPNP